jgi:hypothetical protein
LVQMEYDEILEKVREDVSIRSFPR